MCKKQTWKAKTLWRFVLVIERCLTGRKQRKQSFVKVGWLLTVSLLVMFPIMIRESFIIFGA